MAAMMSLHAEKCYHLANEFSDTQLLASAYAAASASS